MTPEERVNRLIADGIIGVASEMVPGHCLRIDDFPASLCVEVTKLISGELKDADVWRLWEPEETTIDISTARATSLRNRKLAPLILLIPAGSGYAASSLDNSFERLPFVELLSHISERLKMELLKH